jgi:Photosynthesis system II assembly factor YCF48/Putative zinc-finger
MEQLPKIVQRRLQRTAKLGVHPDPDLLAAFVERSLTHRERSQVLQHLADCADCRDVMALAIPKIESTLSPRAERSPWLSWPVLRWGALAACVVVVSAAVTLHYQRRQIEGTSVAEKTPAAPASLTAENKVAQQPPREKLAANIPPPAPFQSVRDSGAAGKLAKQQENIAAGMAAARAGVSVPQRLDQNEKDEELSNNRLADAVAIKSADKAAPSARMLAGAAPAPVPPAAQAAPEAEARNATIAPAPSAAAETVTVGRATSVLETVQTPERKAKDQATQNESRKEAQAARAGTMGTAALGGRKTDSLSAQVAEASSGDYAKRSRAPQNTPRWTLSADGILQRSFDSGKTWQTIPVASNVVFRALAANVSDIWVGGAAGALYHSSDAGQHWLRVTPVADGQSLTADIATVEFSDAQHGKLTTRDREVWTTTDAGDTWQKH